MIEIISVERINKAPYTEVIGSGEDREERLAPVFEFYQVELNINQEYTFFEAEVRDGGWGREKPLVTWDFEEKVYSLITGKEYKEALDFIGNTIFEVFVGVELEFPLIITHDEKE